jgi:nicotinate-nucleotide--dimethylbenzimidazole phosphoribosyltransferase
VKLPNIQKVDVSLAEAARMRQNKLTKPPGSLGRLEELSIQLCSITGKLHPVIAHKAVIIMAGDHGVTAEGVSAYPTEVTTQMVMNFLKGGAAINVLTRQIGARVVIVDVGIAAVLFKHDEVLSDISTSTPNASLVQRKVAFGTQNMALGPAMTPDQVDAAIMVGLDVLEYEVKQGLDLVATGDMGIGNTTASAAIVSIITGMPPGEVTGRGTGLDEIGLRRKVAVIERAIQVNQPNPFDPLDVLSKVGGLEIAGLVGVILSAASHRLPIVIDGLVSGAAALLAVGLIPDVKSYLIASHQSVEIGHKVLLEYLGLNPLLDLELRLGEGTGAVLAFPIIEAAVRILNEMATFTEAHVSDIVNNPYE